MDKNEIIGVIQTYFDASFESSGEKMARVFHDAAHIYGLGEDGKLADMPKDFFVKMVGTARPDAPKLEYPRDDEIISIDFTGDNTAVARVKLRVGKTMFTDMLCFLKLDGKWGVISKVYSGVQVE
ncbi:MAG: nuclear transport factor 2 family protein [Oscillospiraceae bacterium]|nr:nuclear transport factor 2 family protein [Oscillospiraceae bacterium]